MSDGKIRYTIELDTSKMKHSVEDAKRLIEQMGGKMVEQGKKIDGAFGGIASEINSIKTQMLGFLTIGGATLLAKEIFNVRNEFQKLESSFTTMLQSKAKADQLMSELTTLAATTPFGLQDVAEGAKRLLAFQVPAQEVTQTLKRMGDVAAGLGVPMGQLIHVYGQIKAQGKMMTNDLYQFMNAGIPIIAELSKVLKISEQDVKELVSQGKIGFTEIQQVFQNMTNQGGLFYNMMEGQSKTLGGQLSNLQDNISQMFNELGKSSEGIFSGAIQGANFLVENYQKVGKIIAGLVAVYGTYRTALMVNLVLTQGLSAAAQKDALAKGIQTIATKAQTLAQWKLNAAMLANPWGIVLTAIVAVGAALWAMHDSTTASERALNRLNAEKEQAIKNEQEYKSKMEEAISTATNQALADTERIKALNLLKAEYPNIFAQYDIEKLKLADILQIKQQIAEEDAKRKTEKTAKSYEQSKADLEEFSKGFVKSPYKNGRRTFKIDTKVNAELEKELTEEFGKAWRHQANEVETYLKKKLQETKKEVKGDKVSAWQKALEGQSVEDLQAQINQRKRLIYDLQQQEKEGKKWASHGVEMQGDWFAFDQKELSAQVSMLENQIEKIKAPKKSYLEWEKQYRKELAEAQKELSEVSKLTGLSNIEMQKKIDEAKAKVEAKQKQLDNHLLKKDKKETSKKEKDFDPEAFARETQRKAFDNEILTQKNQIEQMAEGFAKEKALIELHYKEKAEAIRRGSEDALLALDKEKKESKGKMSAETYELRKSVIIENQTISNNANEQQKNQQEQKLFENLLNQYKDYETQRTEILEKYAQERAILQEKLNTDISEKERKNLENALSEAEKQKNKAISEIDLKQSDKHILAEMYGEMSDKTVTEIERINERVQEFLQTLQGEYSVEISAKFGISEDTFKTLKNDPEKLKEIAQKGKEINRITIENKGIFHSLKHNIKEALDAKNPQKFQEAMGKIQGNVQQVMGVLGGFASIVKSIGNATQSAGLQELAGGLETVMSAVDSTMQGVQMGASIGGPWGAAIGGTLGLLSSGLSKAAEAEQKHAENMKKIKEAEINYQRTLNDLIFKEQMLMKDKKSIFGTKEIATAIGHLALYKEQWGKLNESINEAEEGYKHFSEISGKAMERHVREHGKLPELYRKGLFEFGANIKQTKLENIQIKTDSYTTGALWWKKTHDVYRSIVDEYPNLINAQGEFNRQQAQAILDTREFADGQKQALQDIVNQYDRAKEAETKFDEYLQNTFGSLGTSMMDSVIQSLKTGEDAFESFAKSVGDTIGTLAKQIAYEIFLADEFKAFQERIKKGVQKVQENNSFSAEEKSKKTAEFMRDQTAQFSDAMKGKIEGMKAFIEDFNKGTAQMGYDFLNNETRQASEKGFAKMSQDTADELHGQFRLLTQLSAESKTALLQISKDVAENYKFMQSHSAQQLKHLAGIETNTFTLHDMKKDLSAMKNTLADMETKGIKIR